MAAAFAQTGAQADDAKGVAFAGDGADQRRAVDRIGDRAVDDSVDADLGQGGHTGKRAFEYVGDSVKVVRAEDWPLKVCAVTSKYSQLFKCKRRL